MSVLERDVVLTGQSGGRPTMDFPITRLANIEDTADVKEAPAAGDYLPIVDSGDGGQMKKAPFSAILGSITAAQEAAGTAQAAAETAQGTADGALAAAQAAQTAADSAAAAAEGAAQAAQTAQETAEGRATIEQMNAAIQAAVLDSWEGSY